jgi:hypothetical protein
VVVNTSEGFFLVELARSARISQEALEKDKPGATIVPILISSDKTQLTLFRNKSAYPLYLTIGNIPKEIRRKPSFRAYVLLAYLPTTRSFKVLYFFVRILTIFLRLESVTNQARRRRLLTNLYHSCLRKILQPLESAGCSGIYMTSGDGRTRRNHPILASFIGDYPEQILTTGALTGECPSCVIPRTKLGDYDADRPRQLRDLNAILTALDTFDDDPAGFLQTCSKAGIKPIINPFWKDLPYAHIFRSITPDVLHQLYQGIVKHVIGWVVEAFGAEEIDARCRRMPPNHNIRHFMKGISSLSRVSGKEHEQMCHILLGLVIDTRLPGGESPIRLVSAVRALLDFLYLAQYPIHTDETLELLEDALSRFHENKEIFVDLGIRDGFNLPKLHFASHYVRLIKLYGTTDNCNTEYTERLHIDLAKDAYHATNCKDEFTQMTIWLERKEKIHRHEDHVKWILDGRPLLEHEEWLPPGLELDRTLSMSKHPTIRSVAIDRLEQDYGATHFRNALRRFIALLNNPRLTTGQLEQSIWNVHFPFRRLPVWHKIKFTRHDPATNLTSTADSIHTRPAKVDSRGRPVPGRFDTALVNDGTGGDTGIEGAW